MDKYYAVIDTNVIVSAVLKMGSDSISNPVLSFEALTAPAKIINLVQRNKIVPIVSTEIIAEYRDVLSRSKFKFPATVVTQFINIILEHAAFVSPVRQDVKLPDPKDAIFYEITMSARTDSDAYLVTGNLKDFPIKPFIVTPHQMLEIINSDGGSCYVNE
ncbi:MAG: putative toxin-antitoxin system toxin component, PIN family [Clostridia bacterium]|nr:putative toxin-antitoxin system toxin component, PIN family [Clostridia bacterium]